jgi:hypothetical protein
MIQSQSLSRTRGEAVSRVQAFRRALLVVMVLDILIGLFILIWPGAFMRLLLLPVAVDHAWPRIFGLMLLGIALFLWRSYLNPAAARWNIWAGIFLRLGLGLLFLIQWGAFLWLALYMAATALVLFVTRRRAAHAELMSYP